MTVMQKRLGRPPNGNWNIDACRSRMRMKADAKEKADRDYREELRRYLALLRVMREERRTIR